MASKHMETKVNQKTRYAGQMESRTSLLQEKGLKDKEIAKDPKIKQYKAKIKQIDGAIARILFLENQTKQLQEKKEQRIAEAAAAKAEAVASGKKVKAKKEAEPEKKAPAKKKAPAAAKGQAKGKPEAKKKG
ncbi:MAG: hypothetical protein HY913_16640 [Desulfomonile tiedjei]|nr:hypothetical protein [Desulfomonile tiedjei]